MMHIDVDDPATWPTPVAEAVQRCAEPLAGTTEHVSDLDVNPDDGWFRDLLGEGLLIAYHCARLLTAEVADIRLNGMRVLSQDLVAHKLMIAVNSGALTEAEAEELRAGDVFAGNRHHHRTDRVCVFTSRHTLDLHVAGLWRPLTTWGGEAIYFTSAGNRLEERLRSIGKPSILKLGLDVSGPWTSHHASPGILTSFIGRSLELEDYGTEIHYMNSIPPSHVIDIWQPGDAEFDIHTGLADTID